VQREKIGEEANSLRQQLGTMQTEISTRQSQFDNVLRVGYQNVKIQLSKVDQQQKKLEKEINEALQQRDNLKKELDDLEKSRVELSNAVFSAREESKKFTSQIDVIDTELRLLDTEYEQADMLLNQLTLTIQTSNLRHQTLQNQLKQYGFEQALETTRNKSKTQTQLSA
jgi:chromosome segregation ATPase